jgi:hypothetical protein
MCDWVLVAGNTAKESYMRIVRQNLKGCLPIHGVVEMVKEV